MTLTRFTLPTPTLQRSLACLVLSSAGLFSTGTYAAVSDYDRARDANSDTTWGYSSGNATNQDPYGAEVVEEVQADADVPQEAAPVPINPAYGQRLMDSIRAGNLNQVKWLLANGADPEYANDPSRMTPMHLAAKSGWVQLAQLLHEAGGDFTRASPNGTTYLHIAAASNRLPMVKYLLNLGVDVNARTNKGWSPLHHAARFGSTEVVQYLLAQGAEANRYNSDGFTAHALAQSLNHYDSAAVLEGATQVASRAAPKPVQTARTGRRTLRSFFGFNS